MNTRIDILEIPKVAELINKCEQNIYALTGFSIVLQIGKVVKGNEHIHKNKQYQKLVKIVCEYFTYEWEEIRSASRKNDLPVARFIFQYIAFTDLGISKSELGRQFRRDHSSIIHAVKEVEGWIEVGDAAGEVVKSLQKILHAEN